MSATPTKDEEVEQGGQSPDEQENQMAESEAQAQALGYDLDVKEQDRWLPIANGMYHLSYNLGSFLHIELLLAGIAAM
jgi:nuclear transcription Y subunit beta